MMEMNATLPFGTSQQQRLKSAESFVISFDRPDNFRWRNAHSDIAPVLWQPAVDGFHQPTLNTWARLTNHHPPLNASLFGPEDKSNYTSPHAVGCYLAHWHLLRNLGHRERRLRPDAYMVFEDDTGCIPNLKNRTLEVLEQLPTDWDLLYIGGTPFTYFRGGPPMMRVNNFTKASSLRTLQRDICRGDYGYGETGPFAPDGSRRIRSRQPYWQIKYLTNTDAYVVNPQRIHRVLEVIHPRKHVPIDILLANTMREGKLNAYMTTTQWCRTGLAKDEKMLEPVDWEGYFRMPKPVEQHPRGYVWNKMIMENCTY